MTSVAKKSQSLGEAAAAIHVITQEDIRRSGMTSVPELLRLVPGANVARINGNQWAISIRGFNGLMANKLLVLIDGRSVYSPAFAGVNWDEQNVLVEDIERIEVIRGPGGTLWGANAVNGVINVITKQAKHTQGNLLVAGIGDREESGAYRYGGQWGDEAFYRAYIRYVDQNPFDNADGSEAYDSQQTLHAGFRVDWALSNEDELTLQGGVYDSVADQQAVTTSLTQGSQTMMDHRDLNGGNLLFHWTRSTSEHSEWQLQGYFDRTERDELNLGQRIDTYDLELQHRFPWSEYQEITWGLGYRRVSDRYENSDTLIFGAEALDTDLFSAFLQDEITLREDLRLTLGAKLEHNDFTGYEFQPSARMLWQPTPQYALWGAVSRAVRTPSRSHRDLRINLTAIPGPTPTLISLFGNNDVQSENLIAYELGFRNQVTPNTALDITAFYNVYDDLLTDEDGASFMETDPQPTHLVVSKQFDNLMEGEVYGIEVAADWRLSQRWRVMAGYSWLQSQMHLKSGSTDSNREQEHEGNSPQQQLQLRSYFDLRHDLELDAALYMVDQLPSLDIPGYARLDLRLAWRPAADLELSLIGSNLLDARHPEYTEMQTLEMEVPRSIVGKLVWRW